MWCIGKKEKGTRLINEGDHSLVKEFFNLAVELNKLSVFLKAPLHVVARTLTTAAYR